MGRIRTSEIKRGARILVQKHYNKLNLDFVNNKQVVKQYTQVTSKKDINQIAGYATHLLKRMQNEGSSDILVQKEYELLQRIRDFEPEFKDLFKQGVKIDQKTKDLFKDIGLEKESFT